MGPATSPVSKVAQDQPTSAPLTIQYPISFDLPYALCTVSVTPSLHLNDNVSVLIESHPDAQLKGISVFPTIFSSPFPSQFQLHLSSTLPQNLSAGDVVAKMILVSKNSDNAEILAVTTSITETKPTLQVVIKGKTFSGLLDSGADVSVIRAEEWPPSWPTENSPSVRGVGGIQPARISKNWLRASAANVAATANIKPLILPLHTNLWGRDLLSQFNAKLLLE